MVTSFCSAGGSRVRLALHDTDSFIKFQNFVFLLNLCYGCPVIRLPGYPSIRYPGFLPLRYQRSADWVIVGKSGRSFCATLV